MLTDRTKSLLRKSPATFCVALFVAFFCPPVLHSAGEPSYAEEIRRYVAEDKVYLLKNIRGKVTLPAEKLVIDALLSEDAPQAVALYQKQLTQYSDPVLDQISTSRIAAYSMAREGIVPLPKLKAPEPSPKQRAKEIQESLKPSLTYLKEKSKLTIPAKKQHSVDVQDSTKQSISDGEEKRKEVPPVAVTTPFALQCGSFKNRQNAELFVKKISPHATAKALLRGDSYRVLLNKRYASKEEAEAAAKRLPFEAIVVMAP